MPYNEAIALFKQVRSLARGEEVDYMDMTFNALAVLSVVPIAKPLAPLVRGLRGFLDPIRRSNPKFTKAMGGVMAKLGDDVLHIWQSGRANKGGFGCNPQLEVIWVQ